MTGIAHETNQYIIYKVKLYKRLDANLAQKKKLSVETEKLHISIKTSNPGRLDNIREDYNGVLAETSPRIQTYIL